ncbi:hypothetical protein Pint_31411 [Pistacia integerrima]|uniref:Uncharacterized protein n=1 Tax=Pistacia integerrima TaxID=434235 RepID=A0ACC0XNR2_9ROSI|nr:hypothetical protein Pint_31411 [Pistacia integerrima]
MPNTHKFIPTNTIISPYSTHPNPRHTNPLNLIIFLQHKKARNLLKTVIGVLLGANKWRQRAEIVAA